MDRRCRALLIALAIVATALPAGVAGAAPRAKTNDWHVAATLALGTDDTAVSCASATRCWAIEAGQLLSSKDGGATWRSNLASIPSDIVALHDIACPNEARCYITATASDGTARVLYGQQGRIFEHTVGGTETLVAIACPARDHCLTTDGANVYVTRDGATTWQTHALPASLSPSPDLACVTGSDVCRLVGDRGETPVIERTRDDGATWTPESAPSPTDGLYSVACPNATTCYAGGASFSDNAIVLRTVNAGRTWTFASVPGQAYPVRSVSCATDTTCWAIGQSPARAAFVFATTDGQQWNAQTLPVSETAHPAEIACPSPTRCVAVAGGIALRTDDAGAQWDQLAIPAAIEAPQSLSCSSPGTCVAVGNDATGRAQALTSSSGGQAWSAHTLPDGTGRMAAVECPTPDDCVALAAADDPATGHSFAQALRSTDGGVSWKTGVVAGRQGVLGKLTCPTVTTCLASGYDNHSNAKLDVTTDGAKHWRAVAAPAGMFSIDAIACRAADACVVIAHAANAAPQVFTTPDLGATYEPHPVPYSDATDLDFTDADCVDATCVAVGELVGEGVIMRSIDGGTTWTAAKVPLGAMTLGSVSCGTDSDCAATAFDFRQGHGPIVVESTNAGARWHAEPVPARQEQPIDIACHALGCIASDVTTAGNPIILAGTF